MHRVAEWLAASFWNSALAAAAGITVAAPLAGAVVVFRTLIAGPREGMAIAIVAMSGLLGVQAISSSLFGHVDPAMLETRRLVLIVPVLAVAAGIVIRATSSLKLVVQLSVLVGALIVGVLVVAELPLERYFSSVLASLETLGFEQPKASGQITEADVAAVMRSFLAWVAVFGVWLGLLLSVVIGNGLAGLSRPEQEIERFRELSFGRVIAGLLALLCLVASVSASLAWVAMAVFVLTTFIVAGLALAHWFSARTGTAAWTWLAYLALVLPVVNVVGIFGLAVLGYCDAWFDFRKRLAPKR